MLAPILTVADKIELDVRNFLKNNDGGKFPLPDLGKNFLVIPLIITILEQEGWEVTYKYCADGDCLEIEGAQIERML